VGNVGAEEYQVALVVITDVVSNVPLSPAIGDEGDFVFGMAVPVGQVRTLLTVEAAESETAAKAGADVFVNGLHEVVLCFINPKLTINYAKVSSLVKIASKAVKIVVAVTKQRPLTLSSNLSFMYYHLVST